MKLKEFNLINEGKANCVIKFNCMTNNSITNRKNIYMDRDIVMVLFDDMVVRGKALITRVVFDFEKRESITILVNRKQHPETVKNIKKMCFISDVKTIET